MPPSVSTGATDREAEGLPLLDGYGGLEAPPAERFDRITRLAAELAGTPMAMISLVDAERRVVRSYVGREACESARADAFCTHTLASDGPFVVEDAAQDARFAGTVHVAGDPHARFYAGIPLEDASGQRLGALCVVDTRPRSISEQTLAQLETLAAFVVDELELARRTREAERARLRHADELAEREAAFRALAEHSPDIVARYDRDLHVLYVNPTAERISGIPRAAQIGRTTGAPGAASAAVPGWADHIRRVFDTGETRRVPFAYPCVDGSVQRYEAVLVPERSEGDAVTSVLVFARDVTAHVASERRYRALVDATSSLVWRMGADGESDLELVGGELLTGEIPEVTAGNWLDFVHPRDRSRAETMWREAVRSGGPLETEYRLVLPDGRVGWFTARAVPVRDEAGHVSEWVGANTEVTARKEAEAAVQRSERRFRNLVQNSSEVITLLGRDAAILYQSPSIERITAHRPDDLVGQSAYDFIHDDDRPEVLRVFGGVAGGPNAGTDRVQFRFRKADGAWMWLESIATNMLDDPDVGAVVVNSRDITWHRRAEADLRESAARYRALSHLVQSFAYAYDVPGDGSRPTIAWITGSVEEVLGQPPSVYEGMPWGGQVSDADQAISDARLAAALRGESRVDDLRVMDGDGQERWIRFVSEPEVDPETGRVARIYGAGQDVTGQKTREAELIEARVQAQQSEAALRQMADAMPQIVWTTRPDGYHDYFNARWYDYTGMPTDGLRGWSWPDYLHPDDVAETKALWEHALATGDPYEVEHRFRRASDGAYRWFMARAEAVRNARGHIERWFGTCTDVHDLREAREAVRESEERFRLIAQTTSDAIWDWDISTRAFWHGGGIDTLFGYDAGGPESFTGSWQDRVHPDDTGRVQASLRQALENGAEWRDEYRFRRADGTYAHVVDRGMIIRNADGVAVRMVGTISDVTADREHEAALVEAKEQAEAAREKAEEMGRLKDAFLANMSHEIRTPLTSILGFADLLHEVVDDDGRELVEYIQTGGQRLRDTLTSVLEFAQLQAGRIDVKTEPIALAPLVDETLQVLAPQARKNQVTLTASVVPPSLKALAERGALGRILLNLVGNAIKFTPAGGFVHVKASSVQGRVAIAVSDTGVGIGEAFLPHLFDDFQQESQGLGRSHEGSGLGLAITRRLVELMGGTIAVESAKGTGTTVTVHLPGVGVPPASPGAEDAAEGNGAAREARARGPRVLLVEDDESTRAYVQYALKAFDLEVTADAEAALAAAADAERRGSAFEVALVDINLGGGRSGVDLVPLLRQSSALRRACLVAMTAYALPGDEKRFLAAGFDRYIAKPFTRDALLSLLNDAGCP